MASLCIWSIYLTLVSILANHLTLSSSIGVNYGRNADNLPSPTDVVGLYKKCNIELIRLYDPSSDALEALRGSNLQVSLGVRNEDVQTLGSDPNAATQWVNQNVSPYKDDVKINWIVLGNEVIPGTQGPYVTQAMQNILNAINSIGLTDTKVTTSFYMAGLATSYPQSAGAFTSDVENVMRSVAPFLAQNGAPLMVNVYPYFPYTSDPSHVSFEYAAFKEGADPVIDGDLKYDNLFDAMIDSIYAALEKIGAGNVNLIVGETGWPTAGNEPYTSKENAMAYNGGLIRHLSTGAGTPRRPNQALNAFIFAMFNEDQKQSGVEQNWGIFYPSMDPVYPLFNTLLIEEATVHM